MGQNKVILQVSAQNEVLHETTEAHLSAGSKMPADKSHHPVLMESERAAQNTIVAVDHEKHQKMKEDNARCRKSGGLPEQAKA